MKPEDVKSLIRFRMEQADECLADPQTLYNSGSGYRTIVNRSFYAAFYATLALFHMEGKTARKHRGLLSVFQSEFIRTGLIPQEYWEILYRLYNNRLEDDYHLFVRINKEEAYESLVSSQKFVSFIHQYIQK